MTSSFCLLLSLLLSQEQLQPPPKELVDKIVAAHHEYYERVKDLSALQSHTNFEGDVETSRHQTEVLRDKENLIAFTGGSSSQVWMPSRRPYEYRDFAGINRVRGKYRQKLSLKRVGTSRFTPWALDQDAYVLLSEEEPGAFYGSELSQYQVSASCAALRPTNTWITPLVTLIQHPSFKLKKQKEDRSGKEPLVTLDFVMEPPVGPYQASGLPPFHSGQITLRPQHHWTIASSRIEFKVEPQKPGETLHVLSIDYGASPHPDLLPKTVKGLSTRVDKDNNKTEQLSRSSFHYQRHERLPAEKFSLTQFGLPEREPGQGILNAGDPAPTPQAAPGPKNFLTASNVVPPYVWGVGGLVTGLVLGVGWSWWRSPKNRQGLSPISA